MGRISSIETGTKLYISNLDYGVSNDDVKVILLALQFFSKPMCSCVLIFCEHGLKVVLSEILVRCNR